MFWWNQDAMEAEESKKAIKPRLEVLPEIKVVYDYLDRLPTTQLERVNKHSVMFTYEDHDNFVRDYLGWYEGEADDFMKNLTAHKINGLEVIGYLDAFTSTYSTWFIFYTSKDHRKGYMISIGGEARRHIGYADYEDNHPR